MDHGERTEHRAFVIAQHASHGFLLLHAEKKRKGGHFQLPGGRADRSEVETLGLEAAQVATAARELFEETGIDLRQDSARFLPISFPPDVHASLGTRVFFRLSIDNADSVAGGDAAPMSEEPGFVLRLSHEHNGFAFERDLLAAAEAVEKHSGGKCALALRAMAGRGG
eukprot:CAMPEP_0117600954 /NCGR_PEP_ID=MMETSP0784-20121206/76772_1 /TAXON_ID=39447 /ORGANISM="" /LENGTH=167 /DNA_ID=CAMNT_0005403639 /DNA_START=57 /DNA_END=557 /DNA_ORIENTATION=-